MVVLVIVAAAGRHVPSRYSSSVISAARFCRGGWAAGAFAELEVDAPPNIHGFVRFRWHHQINGAVDLAMRH